MRPKLRSRSRSRPRIQRKRVNVLLSEYWKRDFELYVRMREKSCVSTNCRRCDVRAPCSRIAKSNGWRQIRRVMMQRRSLEGRLLAMSVVPARKIERVIVLLVEPGNKDDFLEHFNDEYARKRKLIGPKKAAKWRWGEILRTTATLLLQFVRRLFENDF